MNIGFIGLGVMGKPMARNLLAHELGVPVPLTGQVMEITQALRVDGKQKDDHGGVIQFYERLARVKVRAGGSPA